MEDFVNGHHGLDVTPHVVTASTQEIESAHVQSQQMAGKIVPDHLPTSNNDHVS